MFDYLLSKCDTLTIKIQMESKGVHKRIEDL